MVVPPSALFAPPGAILHRATALVSRAYPAKEIVEKAESIDCVNSVTGKKETQIGSNRVIQMTMPDWMGGRQSREAKPGVLCLQFCDSTL
jgi:hypothetical protein